MQTLSLSELNDQQRAQVTYLFADEIFGTDASAFAYELVNEEVKGRSRIAKNNSPVLRAKQNVAMQVHMIEEVHITDELIRHTSMSMDALAASIASRIYQSQTQSIEMENS